MDHGPRVNAMCMDEVALFVTHGRRYLPARVLVNTIRAHRILYEHASLPDELHHAIVRRSEVLQYTNLDPVVDADLCMSIVSRCLEQRSTRMKPSSELTYALTEGQPSQYQSSGHRL